MVRVTGLDWVAVAADTEWRFGDLQEEKRAAVVGPRNLSENKISRIIRRDFISLKDAPVPIRGTAASTTIYYSRRGNLPRCYISNATLHASIAYYFAALFRPPPIHRPAPLLFMSDSKSSSSSPRPLAPAPGQPPRRTSSSDDVVRGRKHKTTACRACKLKKLKVSFVLLLDRVSFVVFSPILWPFLFFFFFFFSF